MAGWAFGGGGARQERWPLPGVAASQRVVRVLSLWSVVCRLAGPQSSLVVPLL